MTAALAGKALLFLGCTALGVLRGQGLRQRAACLQAFRRVLAALARELAFSPGLTLYGAMELLAQEAPAFARRLADEGEEAVLGGLLFSVDGAVYDRSDRGAAPLRDGCEVKVFMPYAGG